MPSETSAPGKLLQAHGGRVPRGLVLVLTVLLASCARRPEPLSSSVVNDRSVTFPVGPTGVPIKVGSPGQAHELDGIVLRALMIAANDLFPPGLAATECRKRPEAHTWRVIREGDVIFIYVQEDLEYCGRQFPAMDSGAKYAISTDGRILRRVVDGLDEDDAIWRLKTPDGGTVTVIAEPGVVPDATALDAPDSGILKVIREPVEMPGAAPQASPDGGLPE